MIGNVLFDDKPVHIKVEMREDKRRPGRFLIRADVQHHETAFMNSKGSRKNNSNNLIRKSVYYAG